MATPRLAELSVEVLLLVAGMLDTDSLLTLELASRQLQVLLCDIVAARCKRECFTTYLYPTISTYRMLAPVPETWRELYLSFSKLRGLRWSACKTEGTSSSLRALKSDNQEYEVDCDAQLLLRSGGHYWFSVWQQRLEHASLAASAFDALEQPSSDAPLAFLRSPRTICMGTWTKIRATNAGPSPRRHHSMTCLDDAMCLESALLADGSQAEANDREVATRRVLFFGGQEEGIPFAASNDLFLLGVKREPTASSSNKIVARWLTTIVAGQTPSRRSGHVATLLSPELLLISGGSDGTTPIPHLEVHLLHIEGCAAFRWSTPVCANPPSGRALHSVCRVSCDQVVIFGGRQIRESNSLLSVRQLRVISSSDTTNTPQIEWTAPAISGDVPHPRRGHSTTTIGEQLLLFGGQDMITNALTNDLRVFDARCLRWREVDVPGQRPCPRRGFKTQFFGTSLVVSSGFVETPATGKVDTQLTDGDVHVLTIA